MILVVFSKHLHKKISRSECTRKGVRKGSGPPFPFLDSFGSYTCDVIFNGQGYSTDLVVNDRQS